MYLVCVQIIAQNMDKLEKDAARREAWGMPLGRLDTSRIDHGVEQGQGGQTRREGQQKGGRPQGASTAEQ